MLIWYPKRHEVYRMFDQDQTMKTPSRLMKFCRLFHCAREFASVVSDWSKTRFN